MTKVGAVMTILGAVVTSIVMTNVSGAVTYTTIVMTKSSVVVPKLLEVMTKSVYICEKGLNSHDY